ncbi:hypothetical protein THRCLA_20199 [Thraustotheca clavata]|uniref:Uncharacterized protein n=1 Tax=Thraustotheca clavata TaxID=74557 RepID=A0A1W0AAH9_9STRA|nr:hypothetical protein THRCLA_20199 [Thraustotheca clavata]
MFMDGWTLLHIAAEKGRKDTVSLLLSNGAKIDQAMNVHDIETLGNGGTPLPIAASHGHTDIVLLFLSNKAKIDLVNNASDFKKHSD